MNYTDVGFNQFLLRPLESTQDRKTVDDFDQNINDISFSRLIPEGIISSKNGALSIDFDSGIISLKKDKKEVIFGGEEWLKITDKNGVEIINENGLVLDSSNFQYGIKFFGTENFVLADLDNEWQSVPGLNLSFSLKKSQYVLLSFILHAFKENEESRFFLRIMNNNVPLITDYPGYSDISSDIDFITFMQLDQDYWGSGTGSTGSAKYFSGSFIQLFEEGTYNLRFEGMKAPETDVCRFEGSSNSLSPSHFLFFTFGK